MEDTTPGHVALSNLKLRSLRCIIVWRRATRREAWCIVFDALCRATKEPVHGISPNVHVVRFAHDAT